MRHGLRRGAHQGSPRHGHGRGRDHRPFHGGARHPSRSERHSRHRRTGHEVPPDQGRSDLLDTVERGLLLRLRLLPGDLCPLPRPRHPGARCGGPRFGGAGGPRLPLHRIHELAREAGPKGRGERRRYLRRAFIFGDQERPAESDPAPRPERARRKGCRSGRHQPTTRCCAPSSSCRAGSQSDPTLRGSWARSARLSLRAGARWTPGCPSKAKTVPCPRA